MKAFSLLRHLPTRAFARNLKAPLKNIQPLKQQQQASQFAFNDADHHNDQADMDNMSPEERRQLEESMQAY